MKDPLGKFSRSLGDFGISAEWQEVTYQYIVLGLTPGSFFTSLFANDFVGMALHSHPSNTWGELINLGKWLSMCAPVAAWGSYEKVEFWMLKSQEERDKLCEECGLKATAWEILSTSA